MNHSDPSRFRADSERIRVDSEWIRSVPLGSDWFRSDPLGSGGTRESTVIPDDLENIQVKNFSLNITAHVQPKDQGIIQCFKAHYHTKFIERAID